MRALDRNVYSKIVRFAYEEVIEQVTSVLPFYCRGFDSVILIILISYLLINDSHKNFTGIISNFIDDHLLMISSYV